MEFVPILTYHSLDDSGSVLSTPPELFREQMTFLAAARYQTLTVSEAVSCLRGERQCSEHTVALTFDDGFHSVFDVALPVMRALGFRATAFIVSGRCGQENTWETDGRIPKLPLMGPTEIRELARAGWEIGAHSATHARLTRLDDRILEEEVNECRLSLQEIAGATVRCLAYPYGAHDRRVRTLARKPYESACSTELGYSRSTSDLFALPRIDMYYLRPARLFRALEAPWMAGYLRLRRWLRRVRGQ